MFLVAPILFLCLAWAIHWIWGRIGDGVPRRITIFFLALVFLYEGDALLTDRHEIPAGLAFKAYPWRATGNEPVEANTGIVFTQLVPWTTNARSQILNGELPLWNRTAGAGTPLLHNQQTAIFHPFTLAGLLLPVGDAWTLTASLRLFWLLFFVFVLLRRWSVSPPAATFGAVAYAFCTFNVVWLLFPLGLAAMMLPSALAATEELVLRRTPGTFLSLTLMLSLLGLAGHPEVSLMAAIVVSLYALYRVGRHRTRRSGSDLFCFALAGVAAMMLTSPVWLPTLKLLPETPRYAAFEGLRERGVQDRISADWLLPLIAPNVLGTVPSATYRAPVPSDGSILSDYGEVASGYAGAGTLAFALVSIFFSRRPRRLFLILLMAGAFLTLYEAPGWHWILMKVPLVGIALHQRVRFLWAAALAMLAALALDDYLKGRLSAAQLRWGLIVAGSMIAGVLFFRLKEFMIRDVVLEQLGWFGTSLISLTLLIAIVGRLAPVAFVRAAVVVTFIEIVVLTWSYNPAGAPIYPRTPSVLSMKQNEAPSRIAAMEWSFIPDTPGYYELEDLKTTDPIQLAPYMKVFRHALDIAPDSYDQIIGNLDHPLLDFLNVRYVYKPPGGTLGAHGFRLVYRGTDGDVYENRQVQERYQLRNSFIVQPDFAGTLTALDRIDMRSVAVIDHVPEKILALAGQAGAQLEPGTEISRKPGGSARLKEYRSNSSEIEIDAPDWSLLLTSDADWPGWRAHWNGVRIPTVRANGAFVGVLVPPEKGTLTLRYRPKSFDRALNVSGLALVLLTFGLPAWQISRVIRRR